MSAPSTSASLRPPWADPAGYLQPGPFSDPGDEAERLERLVARAGREPRALAEAVRSLMIHVLWRSAYGLAPSPAREAVEMNLRDLRAKLRRIGELQAALGRDRREVGPLPPEQKLMGNCRDHSLLLAALLRAVGVPARARAGFARYFVPDVWIDHWVVERWDGARWAISDAQLDDLMRDALGFGFDPMDLPDGAFVSAGEAWLACRGGDDPKRYGLHHVWGWEVVKANLVKDVNALAGRELLAWDVWGLAVTPDAALDEEARAEVDAVARATPMRAPLSRADAAALADRPAFRLPPKILTIYPAEVDLGPILGA